MNIDVLANKEFLIGLLTSLDEYAIVTFASYQGKCRVRNLYNYSVVISTYENGEVEYTLVREYASDVIDTLIQFGFRKVSITFGE